MIFALSGQSTLKTTSKSVGFIGAMLLALSVGIANEAPQFLPPVITGQLTEPKNKEASGIAPSRRSDQLFWTHSDSGGEPALYAVAADGSTRGAVQIDGVKNVDWEDLASFEMDGQPMLLVADVGDNRSRRTSVVLHVISEPHSDQLTPGQYRVVRPDYSIHFIYEDGARDCESVAVDVREKMVYLLSKRDVPARLYRLPLRAASEKMPAAARLVGTLPHLPQPVGLQEKIPAPLFRYRGQPTAMDFSNDGRSALVLVYGGPLLFPRKDDESWADALAREPIVLPPFNLPQAEAACFSRDDRSIFVTSEVKPDFLRYDRAP